MSSTCEFQLSSPNGVYYSGQSVSGAITLNNPNEQYIRNVRVRLVGESKVCWTEAERNRNPNGKYETRTSNFRAKKVYIDNSTVVFGGDFLPQGIYGKTVHLGGGFLPAGTHTYNINIPLPRTCPTSFEGKYGHIRYVLWLIVDMYGTNDEFNKPLTVLRTVDLNLNPEFRVPLQAEELTGLGCWPCNSGKISYSLHVPFGAYAPGQTLRYSILIQNQSMTDIRGYTMKFNECITFTAHYPHHKTREIYSTLAVQNHTDDTCLRLSNRQFDGELVVPALPADTEGNRLICVRHTLDIELALGRCHANKCISVPIFIGTVPIREILEDPVSFTPIMSSDPLLANDTDVDLPPSYGDFKLPAFEEAAHSYPPFEDTDANDHTNVIGFRP